jgi:tRNA (cytosine34-C5)-methyltransferase
VSNEVPLLKRRKGITHWKIMDKSGNWYENCDSMSNELKEKFYPTIFPPENIKELNIDRCMRVLPHDQDTGGFFVAVLELVEDIKPQIINLEHISNNKHQFKVFELNESTKNDLKLVQKYYNMEDNQFDSCVYSSSQDAQKKLFYISPIIKNIVFNNPGLRIINTGVRYLEKCAPQFLLQSSSNDFPTYRICQEGLGYLGEYIRDRIVNLSIEEMKLLVTEKEVENSKFSENKVSNLDNGPYIFMLELPNVRQLVNGWKGPNRCTLMIKKIDKETILNLLNTF